MAHAIDADEMAPPDIEEILRAVRLRLETLRPLVEECARLEEAEQALGLALDAPRRGRRK
jgi:hypothetical protein